MYGKRKQKCYSRAFVKIERTNRPIALLWIVSEVDDSKEARLLRVLPSEKFVYRVRNQQQHLLRIQSCGYQIPPIHSRELQSRERRSLTLKSSAKGILPEFECRAQKRVHVETALISLRQPPHYRYGGAAFKEKYVCKTM